MDALTRRLAVVLMVLCTLVLSTAQAQPRPAGVLGRRVAQTVADTYGPGDILNMFGGMSADEMRAHRPGSTTGGGFGGTFPEKLSVPRSGNLIKWGGGGFLLAGSLVYDAIDWCANSSRCSSEVKRFLGLEQATPTGWTWIRPKPQTLVEHTVCYYIGYQPKSSSGGSVTWSYWFEVQGVVTSAIYTHTLSSGTPFNVADAPEYPQYVKAKDLQFRENRCKQPALRFRDLSPSAQREVSDAFDDYITENPTTLRPYLDPQPNENQWQDDPYADPMLDTDGDGWTDAQEYERGTDPSDPSSKPTRPDSDIDTDGDGYPDNIDPAPRDPNVYPRPTPTNPDRDSDGDGWTDRQERERGTDPYDPNSKPEEPEPEPDPEPCPPGQGRNAAGECVQQPCPPGQERDASGQCAVPQEPCPDGQYRDGDTCKPNPCPEGQKPGPDGECQEPPACPEGETADADGKCVPKEEKFDDDCGAFSVLRLMKNPVGWVRDLVIPCEELGDLLSPIVETAKNKFPFSVATSLDGWFRVSGSGGSSADLPSQLGPIPLAWGWLTPLWTTIKTLVGVAMYAWFGYWLIDRFAPRTTL